jgi:hypothetical protein
MRFHPFPDCRDANSRSELSLESQPTSSSVPGSTTTVTVLVDGIFFPMAIPSETCLTSSKTGRRKWSTLWLGVVLGVEADTALFSRKREIFVGEEVDGRTFV